MTVHPRHGSVPAPKRALGKISTTKIGVQGDHQERPETKKHKRVYQGASSSPNLFMYTKRDKLAEETQWGYPHQQGCWRYWHGQTST